jgi:uncharacterized protein (DUF111 family)
LPNERILESDEVYLIETNLDDVPGETVGLALEELIELGALDVCVIPIFCKKNRPGYMVRVTVKKDDLQKFLLPLIEKTGSFGAKAVLYTRHMLRRKEFRTELEVNRTKHSVRVKVVYGRNGKLLRAKPEFADLREISRKTGLTIEALRSKIPANLK